jgi:uncharacterized protein HemY
VQKALVILGLLLVVAGLAWPWLGKLPFGRLPGDIVINRENCRIYIPLATMIIVSILLSLIFWFLRK